MDMPHYVYKPISFWRFVLFPIFSYYENVAVNICVQFFCIDMFFLFLLHKFLSVQLQSQWKLHSYFFYILSDCFLKNLTNLHSYQQCTKVPISSFPHQPFVISCFNYSLLSGWEMRTHFGTDLHFLMAIEVKHFHVLGEHLYISSLEKYVSNSFVHFIDYMFYY